MTAMRRWLIQATVLLMTVPAMAQQDSGEAKAAGRAFAPDGLSTLKTEHRIPEGRPLLFCGEKFMVVLVVGFLYQEQGKVIPATPTLTAFRKAEIRGLQLHLSSGARIHFHEKLERRSIDTWTDARAILECLD